MEKGRKNSKFTYEWIELHGLFHVSIISSMFDIRLFWKKIVIEKCIYYKQSEWFIAFFGGLVAI